MNQSLAAEIAPYLLTTIGFLLIYVLNGIKGELKELRMFVSTLENELRGGIAGLDRRLTVMETKCKAEHGHLMVGERVE